MQVRITTQSGSVYVVRGTRVTRVGRQAVEGYDHAIVGDEMSEWGVPVVGWAWRFRTAAGPFTTSPVVSAVTV